MGDPKCERTDPAGNKLARIGDVVAGVALFVMMSVTVVDVIGRYVFRMPLPASFELTEYLMGLLVFVAVPVAAQRGENIRINLLDRFMSRIVIRIREVAFNALAAVVALGIGWRVYVLANQIRGYGDSTQTLRIPLAPLAYFIAASLLLTAAIFLARAVGSFGRRVRAGRSEWA